MLSGLRSARIQEYAEPVWREAVRSQYHLTALEPEPQDLEGDPLPVSDDDSRDELIVRPKMEEALKTLIMKRERWDEAHSRGMLKALERTDPGMLIRLKTERRHIAEGIAEQRHALALLSAKARKSKARNARKAERESRKRLIRARLDLNRGRRVFSGPVCFHVRVHNISSHYFDSPNAWPTVKPIQDAATNTGIVWDDDNNSCIPVTTFQGGERLGHDYVIDVLVTEIGSSTVMDMDPFGKYDDRFAKMLVSGGRSIISAAGGR